MRHRGNCLPSADEAACLRPFYYNETVGVTKRHLTAKRTSCAVNIFQLQHFGFSACRVFMRHVDEHHQVSAILHDSQPPSDAEVKNQSAQGWLGLEGGQSDPDKSQQGPED